jgi:hypothetical protein
VENQVPLDWQKNKPVRPRPSRDYRLVGQMVDGGRIGAREKCTVVGEVDGTFWLDFVSQAWAEQNLDAVSALLLGLAEGLISPRNQRGGIIIPFPAD